MSDSLRKRIITAAILIALLLVVLLALPPLATVMLLTVAVLLGAWEWSGFLKGPGLAMRAGYVLLIGLLLPLTWRLAASRTGLEWLLLAAFLW